jgi:hypothetical protein
MACEKKIGCHSCETNVKTLLGVIDQFLEVKSFKTLGQLEDEMKSLKGWLLVQWGINIKEGG